LIASEHNYQTQIDRACAAQSSEMLPEEPTKTQTEEEKKRVVSKINRFFN